MNSDDSMPICGVDPFANPLTVLHVAQPMTGGVAEYVVDVTTYQAERGWEVHVAGPYPSDHRNVTHHSWRARRSPAHLVRDARTLARILRGVQADVIVLHSAKAGLVGRLLIRGRTPTVFVPHGWSFLALKEPARKIAVLWERLASRWTNLLVAVSRGEAELAMQVRIRAPIVIAPNGVSDRWLEPAETDPWLLTAAPRGGPVAVSLGRLSRQKGQDMLISAWRQVRQSLPKANLILAGAGVTALHDTGPGVMLLDHLDDPRGLVAMADIVVLPSRWEGCSLAMLQAMAVGRAVVITDVCGSEYVRAARAGAVVSVDDVDALAAEIRLRLQEPTIAAAEGRRAYDYIRDHHRLEGTSERLAAVICRAPAFGRRIPR